MTMPATTDGFVTFVPTGPQQSYELYYKVFGNLVPRRRPLLVIHGGPGLTHDYTLSIADLAEPPHNIPVIFYDQLGCGRSTPVPQKLRDSTFWTLQLYLEELETVITSLGIQKDYDILGHSWGGMLAVTYATQKPSGLNRLVLSNTAVSTAAWMRAYDGYRAKLPEPHRRVLEEPKDFDTVVTPEYRAALGAFYDRHVMTLDPYPFEYTESFEFAEKHPTVTLST
jgi:proline-specific peptidase